jgi:Mn2+/Fe2+ NRAMP family transporter
MKKAGRLKSFAARIRAAFRILGPGLITGAADDDPSGIATYSQTGAQFGFGQLWTSLYQIPLLLAIQETCARIGATTGKGLAHVIKDNNGKIITAGPVFLVAAANTINIGADIGTEGVCCMVNKEIITLK